MSATAALSIRGLVKQFHAFRLGPLDLTVPTGSIYGLIGPNGAGKTTTLDLVMGMGREDAGKIEVMGLDHIREEEEFKRRTGYVSPETNFMAWGQIGRLIRFIRGFYPTWDNEYCARLMREFALKEDDLIKTLSLGNRTRLGLVLALAHRPELLILDEPTIGLDAVGRHQFFKEILAAVGDETRTVIISSHNLADLERFADHLGIIHRGKVLLEGSTNEVLARFQMVDVESSNGSTPAKFEWLRVREHEGPRWRVLVDLKFGAPAQLEAAGFTVLGATPLTLEELFLALVEEANS